MATCDISDPVTEFECDHFLFLLCICIICLDRHWSTFRGAFRFNLYYFAGVLFTIIGSFVVYFMTGQVYLMDTYYINMSLFLAFAAIYPDMQFYLFFAIPVKAKWLGILDGVYFLYTILQAFLPSYGGNPLVGVVYQANAIAAAVSILNFVIFFLGSRNMKPYSPKQRKRKENFSRRSGRKIIMQAEPDTAVPCADAQSWTIRPWSSGIVPDVMGIMSTVRIISFPIYM